MGKGFPNSLFLLNTVVAELIFEALGFQDAGFKMTHSVHTTSRAFPYL